MDAEARVCPFCGMRPGVGMFCEACGRNLQAVDRLPTRAEWEGERVGSGGRAPRECSRWPSAAPTRRPPSLRPCARRATLVPSGRPCRSARPFGGGLGARVGAAPGRPGGLREAASLRAGAGVDGGGPLSPPPQPAAGLGHARLSPLPPHRRTRRDRHAGDRAADRRPGHDAQDPRRRRHRPISGLAARITRTRSHPTVQPLHGLVNQPSTIHALTSPRAAGSRDRGRRPSSSAGPRRARSRERAPGRNRHLLVDLAGVSRLAICRHASLAWGRHSRSSNLPRRVAALDSSYGSSFRSTNSSVPRFRSCCLEHPPRFAVHIPRRGTIWQQER